MASVSHEKDHKHAQSNLQDTSSKTLAPSNVERVRGRLFCCLLVLPMLYFNILIYVLSFLEVQTIHLARRLRSYYGLIHQLAEGTTATLPKDGCKATPTNPGCALSIRPSTDISPVLTSVFLFPTLQTREIGSLDPYVPEVKRGPSIIVSSKNITSLYARLALQHQLTCPAKAWSISSPSAQETLPVSPMSDGGSTCYKQREYLAFVLLRVLVFTTF